MHISTVRKASEAGGHLAPRQTGAVCERDKRTDSGGGYVQNSVTSAAYIPALFLLKISGLSSMIPLFYRCR